MKITKWLRITVPVLLLGTALSAKNNNNNTLTNVPANPKVVGVSSPNVLSPELIEVIVGQGSVRMENTSALTSYYGYDNDVLAMQPDFPRMLPAPGTVAEAMKTEPDKNTYLVSGNGDVIEPDDGIVAIGSGGPFTLAAARALIKHTQMSAREIVQEAMQLAGEICIFTNQQVVIEEL